MTNILPAATPVIPDHIDSFRALRTDQQPFWPDPESARKAFRETAETPLVEQASNAILDNQLAAVNAGRAVVLQLGDCVEDPAKSTPELIARKLEFLDDSRIRLAHRAGLAAVAVGRIAGQYTKPRSNPYDQVEGRSLPAFRGPMVNGPAPTPAARIPDPARILHCHQASAMAMAVIDEHNRRHPDRTIWSSHELLLIDYELAHLRPTPAGNHLASTHWPWIGERTRHLDGAHIAIAATLTNPVSVKIGPTATPRDVAALAERIDPARVPGRLTFIIRMGAASIGRLAPIVEHLRAQRHPVNWVCDPMHGNTVTTARGLKTRPVERIVDELRGFLAVLGSQDQHPGGLHLEATHEDIYECGERGRDPEPGRHYTTLLDPRLNAEQTAHVIDAWRHDAPREDAP
ncbi:3-deoxy-7-phosphoheptulonate synthase [Nocardia sp. NPDC050717]|uniref:3-deoxy-7-phosphoheptulonate synthase n=1 Tax=Nocardia sp. NPDC050717 TaxID=3157221 RepID=UPI0033E5D6A8